MEGLAAEDLKVLYIENTGVRRPGLRDFPRLINRIKSAFRHDQIKDKPSNVEVFSPLAIPLPYNHLAICFNKNYFSQRIKKFLKDNKLSSSEVILWSNLATPVILNIMHCESWGKTIYDVVSDPKLIEPRLETYEKEMISSADFALFASATLYDEYAPFTKNPVLFKDGFNLELLREVQKNQDIEALPRPRFVYIGGINFKIQVEALTVLAEHFKEGSIILVGPLSENFKVPPGKNIHVFPPRQLYRDLAGFIQGADVGLIPYYPDRYSGAMHPAKLNEYLIFGLPVVASATPELARLADQWGEGFFYLYDDTPSETIAMAEKALSDDNEVLRKKRQSLATNNTWDRRIQELLNIFTMGDRTISE
jgi:glycosyltransferase involved in cell wall biosynthesis